MNNCQHIEGLEEELAELFIAQMTEWEELGENYKNLKKIRSRELVFPDTNLYALFNPARINSSAAKTDKKSVSERPCFLCGKNRPDQQRGIVILDQYECLVNPFPLFKRHFTIPTLEHTEQLLSEKRIYDMMTIAASLPSFSILYNGPRCGASAPDHFHFQAGEKNFMPIEKELSFFKEVSYDSPELTIKTKSDCVRKTIWLSASHPQPVVQNIMQILDILEKHIPSDPEPMVNLITFFEKGRWNTLIFPRRGHRPSQYFAEGDERIVFSPGTVDFGGLLTFPREKDLESTPDEIVKEMFQQLTLPHETFENIKEEIKQLLTSGFPSCSELKPQATDYRSL